MSETPTDTTGVTVTPVDAPDGLTEVAPPQDPQTMTHDAPDGDPTNGA